MRHVHADDVTMWFMVGALVGGIVLSMLLPR